MKKICLFLLTICLIGAACKKEEQSLVNTQWKLVGIVDVQTNELTELEPIGCEGCYILRFITNDTLCAWSTSNKFAYSYVIDYKTSKFKPNCIFGTRAGERGDGFLFIDLFDQIQSFSLKEKELCLFYNNKNNYLLFKRLEL